MEAQESKGKDTMREVENTGYVTMNEVHWSPGLSLEALEKQVILAAFRHYRGNKTATSQSLGIAIRTLDNKLEQYQAQQIKAEKQEQEQYDERVEFLKAQRGEPSKWRPKPLTARNERDARQASKNGEKSEAGLSVEPTHEASEKQSVPLPLGQEVQSMSSKHASGNRNNKRR